MNMSAGEQLVHSTIRITCILDGDKISTGTGFFLIFVMTEMYVYLQSLQINT